jgi:hypothetical protein
MLSIGIHGQRMSEAFGLRSLKPMQDGTAFTPIGRKMKNPQAPFVLAEGRDGFVATVCAAVDDNPNRCPVFERLRHRRQQHSTGVVAGNDDEMGVRR